VILPDRDAAEFASTVTVTAPSPEPDGGVTLTHDRLSLADQPVFDVIVIV